MKGIITDFYFIAGVFMILVGICYGVKAVLARKRSIRIPGEVIDFVNEKNCYYPLIRFMYEGEELTMQGANGGNKPKGNVGDQVTVLYDLKNTRYVNIVGSNTDFFVLGMFIALGALSILKAISK